MIHIWLPNPQANPRVWQETTQQWQIVEHWQAIQQVIQPTTEKKLSKRSVCLYFPSLCLLQISPNLSPSQLKTLGENGRKYLFEDISLTAIDDLHIKIESNQNLPSLAAIHANEREQWINAANLVGLEIVALLPDFTLLPLENFQPNNQNAIYYQDKDCQLLAFSNWQGMATGHLLFSLQKQSINKIHLMGEIDDGLLSQLNLLPDVQYEVMTSKPKPLSNPHKHPLNFAIFKDNRRLSPYLKVILSVFILTLFTNMLVDGLRWFYYQKATENTKQEIQQQFNHWFPDERPNPRLSIQKQLHGRLLNQKNHDDHLLPTLASVQMIFQQHQIVVKNLNYHNKSIELQVMAKNSEQLNQVVMELSNQGIHTKLGSVSPQDFGALAMIEIQLS